MRLALADIDEAGLAATVDGLETTTDHEVLTGTLDVSEAPAVQAFTERAIAELGGLDLVVNNAGVALLQRVQDTAREDLEGVMGINFWGVVNGVEAALPHMLERDSGTIVNISSVYGLIGWPGNSVYCAAKFAVRGYTEVMQQDLAGTGVRAVCVHPGGIRTAIVRNSRFTTDDRGGSDKELLVRNFDRAAVTSPEKAARTILRGLERGKPRILIGPDARAIDYVQRLLPTRYRGVIRAVENRVRIS